MITISDSMPFQFWLTGEETFNQANPICGLTYECFCQPSNCDDPIPLQFTDTVERNYILKIFNTDEEELEELEFEVSEVDGLFVYSLDFTFNELGICGQKVRLQFSYLEFANGISGGVTDLIEEVDGDISFVPPAELFDIDGDLTDLIEGVSGTMLTLAQIGFLNSSLDIVVTDVSVDGVSATLAAGIYYTKKIGTYNIVVTYTSALGGQHISLIDSDATAFCENTGVGVGLTVTFVSAVIESETPLSLEAADGACP